MRYSGTSRTESRATRKFAIVNFDVCLSVCEWFYSNSKANSNFAGTRVVVPNNESKSNFKIEVIVAISIGTLVVISIVIVIAIKLNKHRKEKNRQGKEMMMQDTALLTQRWFLVIGSDNLMNDQMLPPSDSQFKFMLSKDC